MNTQSVFYIRAFVACVKHFKASPVLFGDLVSGDDAHMIDLIY